MTTETTIKPPACKAKLRALASPMMDGIRQILELLEGGAVAPAMIATGLAAARLYAMIRMVPFMGGRRAPATLHLALAIALGVAFGPDAGLTAVPSAPMIAVLAIKEVFVGFGLGFLASLPFRFAEQAGMIMDRSRSTSLSSSSIVGSSSSTPVGNLMLFGTLAVFFLTPAHRAFWRGVDTAFTAVPLVPPQSDLTATVTPLTIAAISSSAALMGASVMIAFPVLASVLLTDVVIGAAGRFVPNSGGTFTFMPLRSLVGLGALALSMTLISPVLAEILVSSMRWLGLLL